jgi:nucleoid DNA-binding protein
MQKVDIATRIHQQAGISMEEAARLLDWISDSSRPPFRTDRYLGFGKFTVQNKRARQGRIIEATMISAPSGNLSRKPPVQNSIEFSIGRRVERCGMIAESKAAAALVGGCGGRGSKSHC